MSLIPPSAEVLHDKEKEVEALELLQKHVYSGLSSMQRTEIGQVSLDSSSYRPILRDEKTAQRVANHFKHKGYSLTLSQLSNKRWQATFEKAGHPAVTDTHFDKHTVVSVAARPLFS